MSDPVSRSEGWVRADGVGILLQLDALDLLAGLGCTPLKWRAQGRER